ncbi:MAG: chemotaxis protein CheA, partial [Gemmatimonadales bacterium]|nr:chemotaxis protein CheA [Gemmatimonadales bacterium]
AAEAPAAAPGAAPARTEAATQRVEQARLDRLTREVGELLVIRAAFPLLAARAAADGAAPAFVRDLRDATAALDRLTDALQDTVLGIRMQPVHGVFQRFPRLVRDLARSLGRQVVLTIEGAETAVDKPVLEQLADPLVHLVRNAIDHGIESPAERRAAGKPDAGRLTLRAARAGSGVLIEIADDGRGLDPERLRRRAVEKGILTAERAALLGDAQARELIFEPGFSTAAAVTDVSGRGVGMDVVRANLARVQGTIAIDSAPGSGTTFRLQLPASLMVQRGMRLQAGAEEYIVPLDVLHDLVRIPAHAVRAVPGGTIALVRGEALALTRLDVALGLPPGPEAGDEWLVAVVEGAEGRTGLVIDRCLGEAAVVVRPLASALGPLPHLLGSAVLGDGRLVLVLNTAGLGTRGRPA